MWTATALLSLIAAAIHWSICRLDRADGRGLMPTNAKAWIATAILVLAGLGCLMWAHWGWT
jgi:predicted Co/Zn/Cd cation transporter (cation efflux family)